MIEKKECFRARGNIIAFQALNDDKVIYALQHKTIKSFSTLTCKALSNISVEYLSSQTTAIDFHKSLELVAIANGKTIYIIHTKTKAVLQTIISYTGDIEILHFVQNSPYLITGTKNGRVVQYRYDGKTSLSRLCSFPFNNPIGKKVIDKNYVGAIESNDTYVACSGYGGAITIIKLHSLTHKQTIQSARVRVNTLKFINNELLISATIDSNIYFHNLTQYRHTKTITSPVGIVSTIIPIPNTNYAMVSGESNKIALLDLNAQKVVSNELIKFNLNVKSFTLVEEDTIVAVLEDNSVEKTSFSRLEEFEDLIKRNLLERAYLLVEKNPLLLSTPAYQELEDIYNRLYNQALDALINSNKQEAMILLSQFSTIKSKKDDINLVLNSFEQYKKFHTLVLAKKHHLAYSISENYPTLKRTYPYKKLEDEFKKTFDFAQKQIKIGRMDIADEILSVYKSVQSKKLLVKLLIHNNKDFLLFLSAIKTKNYQNIASLIKKNSVFAQLPQYQDLLDKLQNKLLEIRNNIYQTDIPIAIEKIKQVQYIPQIREQLQELFELANNTKTLLSYYEKNDFFNCYLTLDKSKSLEPLKLSKMLESHWLKRIDKCENLALKGDLKGIKEVLGELIVLKSRSAKVGDLIRLCFQTKIKQLLSKRAYTKAESIIYSYIDIFGLDTEIKTLMRTYEKLSQKKLAITTNQELFKDRDAWLESASIVREYKN
ncbi:hypothetical protein [Sulfurimonas sp. C5]|uniref:hypothetical protein n=1 Tax=Sulfurimonas sp. C5 TaxID=3036947 RepID=UPI0024549A91|nr:hypothetical protein [Sulfurimonas sp. C5]MDH4944900.1 hypothetical protein [Sulfurimonas sp. C5]